MIHKERLGGIRYLLGGYYHQDVWEDHKTRTHEEVWADFLENENLEEVLIPLKRDVQEMYNWSDEKILEFINVEECGGLRLDSLQEVREWISKLHMFLTEDHKI